MAEFADGVPGRRAEVRERVGAGTAKSLRSLLLTTMLLVLVQVGIGMDVNLYVVVPTHHPGAQPANYFTGSLHSVAWALGHGTTALVIHASLGLGLIVLAIFVAVRCLSAARRSAGVLTVLGALLIIGAAFNGASFLDFNNNLSSLLMALLAVGALACYGIAIYLLPRAGDQQSP